MRLYIATKIHNLARIYKGLSRNLIKSWMTDLTSHYLGGGGGGIMNNEGSLKWHRHVAHKTLRSLSIMVVF